jgi:SAM-dependent methyltransferase
MGNKDTTNKPWVVAYYQQRHSLDEPEKIALKEIAPLLPTANFLDIGIGAGRTTRHIAPLVQQYTGIDYAPEMITVCRREFTAANITLHTMDVTQMELFANDSFDIALFSYNGIDYLDVAGRAKAIQEIHRVLKPGGIFIFSSHNTRKLADLYSFTPKKNLLQWLRQIKNSLLVRLHNGPKKKFAGKDFFIIKDGAEHFELSVAYASPELVLRQMAEAGFNFTSMLHHQTGKLLDMSVPEKITGAWIYYIFNKQSNRILE